MINSIKNKLKNNSILMDVMKHAPIYFSGSFITAIIGVFMAKYYTWQFSPAEYGLFALYGIMINYVVQLVSLTMDGAAS